MPQRYSTRRGYNVWLRHRILPCWGNCRITELQARPVELWLQSLELSPKSRVELRGMIGRLWDFAMWRDDVPVQRNPMELVTVKDASKRMKQPRSLTVEEFQKFIRHLQEPFHTIALICICFGLRISECLALKWSDVDWLNGKFRVERGIVRQRVADTKTIYSRRQMSIDAEMLEVLKLWKQTTQFSAPEAWVFRIPIEARASAVVLRSGAALVPKSRCNGRYRQAGHSHHAAQLSLMVGRGRDALSCAAKAHATCRHQDHDERLW